jgi:signal peptidase II
VGIPGKWLLPVSLPALLAADQVLKAFVLARIGQGRVVALAPFVRIRPVLSGRTFVGRFGARAPFLGFVWVGCVLVALVAAPRAELFQTALAQAGLGLALGGAAGNLVDVFVRKAVVDYVELGAWPAFNLADVAIVSGVIGALLAR